MDASAQLEQALLMFRQTHPKRILQVGSSQWEFISGGKGERTIVIVAGAGSTAESMFSLNAALESWCRVIFLGIPTTASTVDDVLRGIQAILDSLGIGQAILLGHSLGGMVVQCFAVQYPQRVAGLVPSNTAFTWVRARYSCPLRRR